MSDEAFKEVQKEIKAIRRDINNMGKSVRQETGQRAKNGQNEGEELAGKAKKWLPATNIPKTNSITGPGKSALKITLNKPN